MKNIQLFVPEYGEEVWAVTFSVFRGSIIKPVMGKYKVAYWEYNPIDGFRIHLYQPNNYGSEITVGSSQIFTTEIEANKYLESLK